MIQCNDQQVDDLRQVLAIPAGRRVMYRLLYDVCDIEGGTFHEKVHDGVCQSQHQNVREGRRDVGIDLQQTFLAHPDLTLLWIDAKVEALDVCREEVAVAAARKTKPKTRRK